MSPRGVRLEAAISIAVAAVVTWGVLAQAWPVFVVMALFWIENVIVGLFNLARMLVAGARGGVTAFAGAVALGAFFTVHYGMFTAVHGVFVVMLFGMPEMGRAALDGGLLAPAARMLERLLADREGWLAVAGLVAFHFTGFVQWIVATRDSAVSLQHLMSAPYGRIVILHITLIASGFVVAALGWPVAGALLLIAIKLAYDLNSLRAANRPASESQLRATRLLTIGRRRLSGRP